jgi:hypothetical protein
MHKTPQAASFALARDVFAKKRKRSPAVGPTQPAFPPGSPPPNSRTRSELVVLCEPFKYFHVCCLAADVSYRVAQLRFGGIQFFGPVRAGCRVVDVDKVGVHAGLVCHVESFDECDCEQTG